VPLRSFRIGPSSEDDVLAVVGAVWNGRKRIVLTAPQHLGIDGTPNSPVEKPETFLQEGKGRSDRRRQRPIVQRLEAETVSEITYAIHRLDEEVKLPAEADGLPVCHGPEATVSKSWMRFHSQPKLRAAFFPIEERGRDGAADGRSTSIG
jgi:hypothetical protein